MSFPIEVLDGVYYDQKLIPVILAFLYGGWITGITVVLGMLSYQFIVGESNFLVMVLNYSIVAVLLILFSKKYNTMQLKWKVGIISIFYLIITATRTIRLVYINEHESILLTLLVSSITWISLMTAILIIENLSIQMRLQHELQRSEKLKVVSELAASVAHEVRNPMTSTRGFLQLMSKDHNLNSTQKRYIDISIEELDRAQKIIQDYLSLAKPNKQGIDIIDLSVEMKHVIQLMSTYTNFQNIAFEQEIEPDLHIRANKDEVKQVLINLIKNAIEAVEKGGIIKVLACSNSTSIIIEIIDNGIGMSHNQVNKLGTPFYSTKDKGTGIGLTIVFQIIELLQGKMEITSELGKGTTFRVILPKGEIS
jgi:two-component system sporulation sensor kinase B